jgi:glycosyltransferase 2 family protein
MGVQEGSADAPPRTWRTRLHRWFPAARIGASALILVFLLHRVRLHALTPKWDHTTILWLAAGVACFVLAIAMSTLRWRCVLQAMDVPSRFGSLFNTYLACQFVSSFLPSSIGGDAVRVTRLSSQNTQPEAPDAPDAFASVVLDRMSGWLILPLLCLAGLAVNPALRQEGRSSRIAVTLSVVSLAALAVVIVVAASPRFGGRLTGRRGVARFFGAVHLGIDRLRHRPIAIAQVLGAALIYQLAVITAALLATHALGIHIGPTALLAFVPAVAIVQVMPVSFGGLGVREGAFVLFLKPLGVAASHAVALGLALYAMQLISSLLGAPSLAVGQRSRGRSGPVVPAA